MIRLQNLIGVDFTRSFSSEVVEALSGLNSRTIQTHLENLSRDSSNQTSGTLRLLIGILISLVINPLLLVAHCLPLLMHQ